MSAKILRFPPREGEPTGAARPLVEPAPDTAPSVGMLDGKPFELTAKPLDRPRRALTEAELALQNRMLQAYFQGARAAMNHTPKTISISRDYVLKFLAFVGQPVWECTPSDFEAWAAHLALERKLAASTQRNQQTAVATFYDYLANSTAWQNEAQRQFKARIAQVATRDNRLTHTTDKGIVRKRRYLTAEELNRLFAGFDEVIAEAAVSKLRQVRALQRDRAMFYTYYVFALRLEEGLNLTLESFSPNPSLPELGPFGFVTVYGKGSRGSGKRFRAVPALLPDIRPVLEWYLTQVRPRFPGHDSESALWLSEQGKPLSRPAVAVRFKNFLKRCGMNPSSLSMHSLRHMAATHQSEAGMPLAATSEILGHALVATTQTYLHLSSEFMTNTIHNTVNRTLELDRDSE